MMEARSSMISPVHGALFPSPVPLGPGVRGQSAIRCIGHTGRSTSLVHGLHSDGQHQPAIRCIGHTGRSTSLVHGLHSDGQHQSDIRCIGHTGRSTSLVHGAHPHDGQRQSTIRCIGPHRSIDPTPREGNADGGECRPTCKVRAWCQAIASRVDRFQGAGLF
jgi:hypothetical protein